MHHRLILAAVFLIIHVGCSRTSSPSPLEPETGITESPPSNTETDFTPLLNEMTQVLRKYSAEKRQVPDSLRDLVSAGYLKSIPKAPAGKEFAIDRKQLKVILK